MRFAALLALALAFVAAPIYAADADAKATNTTCPLKNKPVNADIPPVSVTVGKGAEKKTVLIAVCCKNCAAKVKADPEAAYAALQKQAK